MRIREIRELSADDLRQRVIDLKDQLSRLRFQKAMGQLDNPMKIRNIRKDIARINTVLQEIQKKEAK
ncbi:MAG TPA: 50S ribosomal protein L29 [Candidatus Saccharicenans sp.]|jgi:large subunit ribosomal protein L29|nr:50S ribosomal protein L29 [Candidatus Saccharicenans sp.]HOL46270.1 50S ribosomal protein L29 [Candidatus Saccharicenans sp.]HOM95176.1 50S ribosomal protein L29 [Candidatus Saccharicenans sp.]HOP61188.1 50S ribosomal protein L29 [Candidatus Saccharicenans sp.]HOT69489.1 50S ribosomal protein L29 [Candidatus Saccharicenans sp.]